MVLASYPRVDRLLLPFPSFGVWCDRQTHRCRFGSVGHEEIQTFAWAQEEGTRLVNRQTAEQPESIPSLGSCGNEYGWNDGSPVSREVHAGFCEKLRVKFPRLTHPYTQGVFQGHIGKDFEHAAAEQGEFVEIHPRRAVIPSSRSKLLPDQEQLR